MSKKYDLKELHELTEKEREEIYRHALKRSQEIVDGKSHDDHMKMDVPVPIYAGPSMPPEVLHPTLKRWNSDLGRNAYKDIRLIKKLKEVLDYDDEKVALVLDVLDKICTDCWNNHAGCRCENDD